MNIHRLNVNRYEENNNPRQGGGGMGLFNSNNPGGGQNSNGLSGGLLGHMSGTQGDPRKETFLQMIVINFCPFAAFKSFITYFSILLTIIFIVQLFVGKTYIFYVWYMGLTILLTKHVLRL